MTLKLYLHPFSSYCQKAITAFYEKDIAFEARILDGTEPVASEFNAVWPFGKFPVLTHNGKLVFEATGIIEYLDATHPHTRQLIPSDPLVSADVRMWDRFFDNYINYPQQRLVYIALGREHDDGGNRWRAAFDTAYAFLDRHMEGRKWVSGDDFSLADCAAAPALLYADWTYAIPEKFANVWTYRKRLLARPSYARALDEPRPFRHLFPLGAPEEGRD